MMRLYRLPGRGLQFMGLAGVLFFAGFQGATYAQSSAPMTVLLEKTLDAKKAKVGDAVNAKTALPMKAPDGSLIPRESVISGKVVSVEARDKEHADSTVEVVFAQLEVQGGRTLPIVAKILSIAPPVPIDMNRMQPGASPVGKGDDLYQPGPGLANGQAGDLARSGTGQNYSSDNAPFLAPRDGNPVSSVNGVEVQLPADIKSSGTLRGKGRNVRLEQRSRILLGVQVTGQ